MHRRCIICGQEPGEQCVYPRNMSEARRWQNLANLSSFDVDPESLCRHGCVCASHLNGHGSGSESESSPRAAGRARTPAGLQDWSSRWSSSTSESGHGYPISKKANEQMQNQSKQSLGSERQEFSSANRCTNGYCRFRNTCNSMYQGNTYTQSGQKYPNPPQATRATNLEDKKNPPMKLNPRVNKPTFGAVNCTCDGCTCSFCPVQGIKKAVAPLEEDSGIQQSMNKEKRKDNSKGSPHKPSSCERLTCPAFRTTDIKAVADDFRSSPSYPVSPTSRGNNRVKSSMNQQNTKKKPELKSECCQTCITHQLKDQEVQCSTATLQTQSSSPVRRTKMTGSFSHQTGSSATGFSAGQTNNSSNFTCSGGGERRTSNAINVLLMNGTRNNDYEDGCCSPAKQRPMAPPPEICVQESDLTESDERAVFPEIDKPNYRVCRSSNETNVLVLEESSLNECSPKAAQDASKVDSQTKNHFDAQQNANNNKEQQNSFLINWLESPATSNFTKVLELQRCRIKELENLLEQHSVLQQTIQHKVAELQCTDLPDPKNITKS
ncbi:uncharacterized protein LOC6727998 [Drosophila simulans]|uniref:uncharacterized protein LOC6727998 n=1 Tax=Drosophila simulans TaxID=7240 RepID=UPI00078AE6EB|nr:uncharacterized protein LOC6727998 [Drosophila simulans]KMZ03444.1 uncharacterized protein Dsimw501_GD20367 [Drosophila simulans]